MNIVDIVLIAVVAIGLMLGIGLGFIRLGLPFLAAVAVWASLRLQPGLMIWLMTQFNIEPELARILGYIAVALSALLLTSLAGAVLKFFITVTLTGWLDHLAGAAAGAVLGVGLAALLVIAVDAFGGPEVQKLLSGSTLADPLRDLWVLGLKEIEKYTP